MKVTEGKTVNSHEESETKTIKESVMNEATEQTSFLAAKSNQVMLLSDVESLFNIEVLSTIEYMDLLNQISKKV